jgi:hypothetical protein
MRKIFQWLGIGRKLNVIISWQVGEIRTTIEATGISFDEVRGLLDIANKIAADKESIVHNGKAM